MDLNPQAQELLDQLGKYSSPPLETLSPLAARNLPLLDYAARDLVASKATKRLQTLAAPMPEQVASIAHECIEGPDGEIMLRIYTPSGDGPFPVLVYFHGGGWVIASPTHYDSSGRALANAANCIVVMPSYRQAPEHKYPAAVRDAYAATQWVMKNAAALNGDPSRVAVGGESAGGNLAAVVCHIARDQNGLMPVHQLLVYPVTNYSFDTFSYRDYSHAIPLNAAMMHWFWGHYLRSEADGEQPYASPLRGELAGLPSATVITAEVDPLRDDGQAYADALENAGVPVVYHNYDGVMHEFFGMAGLIDTAREAVDLAADELRKAFAANGGEGTTLLPLDVLDPIPQQAS
jgi:acetyl esterase